MRYFHANNRTQVGKIPLHPRKAKRVRVSRFPTDGAGDEDDAVPDPYLVGGGSGILFIAVDA